MVDLGVLPTPGVAAVAAHRRVPGAVISASHNPFGDNGIKLFSPEGTKLPTDTEAEIERQLASVLADPDRPPRRPTGHGVGVITVDPAAAGVYAADLESTTDGRRLTGLHVVIDCAHGAASEIAPLVVLSESARVLRRSTPHPTGPTSTSIVARPTRRSWVERSSSTRPISAWPSTGTPTG